MLGEKTKSGISATILVPVVIALLAGGTVPWWWNEFFANSKSSATERPTEEVITPSTSDGLKTDQERDRLETELRAEKARQNELKAQQERDRLEAELKKERAKREEAEKEVERKSHSTPPSQPQTNPSQSFSGIYGQARLDWAALGVAYTAVIETFGSTGTVYVTSSTWPNAIVQQDLILQYHQGSWFYVGYDPRWAHNGLPVLYSPDTFKLAPSPIGGWSIVELCDTQWVCAPVTTTPLR